MLLLVSFAPPSLPHTQRPQPFGVTPNLRPWPLPTVLPFFNITMTRPSPSDARIKVPPCCSTTSVAFPRGSPIAPSAHPSSPMSAPLAINATYRAYPSGVVLPNLGYEEYYWRAPKEEEEEMVPEPVHSSEGLPTQEGSNELEEGAPLNHPDLSPRPSSSGMFTHYTPDSATSPNKQLPCAPQGQKEGSAEKKGKTRIAFTQQQLQILQHRFQRQKYLSPQQIRELGSTLGLTYKQVKTWFQNQRMKFKRTQKETLWMKNGICQPQNGCLDMNPSYHQGYAISEAKNFPVVVNAYDSYANSQNYSQGHNFISDHNQMYENPPNFHPFSVAPPMEEDEREVITHIWKGNQQTSPCTAWSGGSPAQSWAFLGPCTPTSSTFTG